MNAPDRLVSGVLAEDDLDDKALRPKTLDDFVGQAALKANLAVFIQAARGRGEPLDHVLLSGPPGLGKTTLAQICAREMGAALKMAAGPALARPGDLAALLTNLDAGDVLFLDEIHRLGPAVEEILYPAMEDFALDLIIGEGPGARSVRIDLAPFTLIGATTRAGLLATPLRDRFGIPLRLDFYGPEDLQKIVTRGAHKLETALSPDGAAEIARRSRGTPRVAGRLLRRVRDIADVEGWRPIGAAEADAALRRLEVDADGLDALDHRYLHALVSMFGGGPVGVDALAAALSDSRDVLEETVEPYLMRQGYVSRTPRGRSAERRAYEALGIAPAPRPPQASLDLGDDL